MSTAPPRTSGPGPSDPLRAAFRIPSWLYRRNLGWLAGRRLLMLTYRGRRTGRILRTVLEVVRHDPATGESVVLSGYGPKAGWYRSIVSSPALRVQTGRLDYVPSQRLLSAGEALEVATAFCREHPLEARLVPSILSWIGALEPGSRASTVELLAGLPMVAFRPSALPSTAST